MAVFCAASCMHASSDICGAFSTVALPERSFAIGGALWRCASKLRQHSNNCSNWEHTCATSPPRSSELLRLIPAMHSSIGSARQLPALASLADTSPRRPRQVFCRGGGGGPVSGLDCRGEQLLRRPWRRGGAAAGESRLPTEDSKCAGGVGDEDDLIFGLFNKEDACSTEMLRPFASFLSSPIRSADATPNWSRCLPGFLSACAASNSRYLCSKEAGTTPGSLLGLSASLPRLAARRRCNNNRSRAGTGKLL
mmetsp:Transcript_68087/g.134335  ORF Transcript_68087/g.134335 Transcript_68087/m.134335 type:complete len:252 (+) Transcript_68087:1341-2096(+)